MSKIYCGSGKKQSGTWIKATINPDKLAEYIQTYEGNRFVKINIDIYDKPNEYGKDVSITIDDYVPNKQETPNDDQVKDADNSNNDDLPF